MAFRRMLGFKSISAPSGLRTVLHGSARLGVLAGLLIGSLSGQAHAQTVQTGPNYEVNALDDPTPNGCTTAHCSLREAVAAANSNPNTSVITFKSGLTGIITLLGSELVLSTNINLLGPSTGSITLSKNASIDFRIFIVNNSAQVAIRGLTLENGQASMGGAIYNGGTLTLQNCTLSDNIASGAPGIGGAIFNDATLTLQNCTLSRNTSSYIGSAVYSNSGSLTIQNSTISGNSGGGDGSAIYKDSAATMTLQNSVVASNQTATNINANSYSGQGATHNFVGGDPKLNALADNGGAVKTMKPQTASLLLNKGNGSLLPADALDMDGDGNSSEAIPFDGRGSGFARVDRGQIDIGAFEVQNSVPVVDLNGASAGVNQSVFYTVGDGATSIVDSGLTVVDADDTSLASATVTITNLQDAASEVLSVTPSGAIVAGDISYNNGILHINKVAPLADYQSVLSSLKYHNTASQPGGTSRSITVVVNDGYANSAAATSTVTLRYKPVVDLNGAAAGFNHSIVYTVGDGATSIVDSGLTVVDGDDSNLDSATATITSLQDAASEVLSVTPSGAILAGDITYNNGVLSINKVAPLADYQSVLRSLKYHNTAAPSSGTSRSITVVVNDGDYNSVAATSTVTFLFKPIISSFTPTSAKRGQTVTINGRYFTGATNVKFNGTSVEAGKFTFVSDTQISAIIPVGATTGPISVTTNIGTGTSAGNFTVAQNVLSVVDLNGAAEGVNNSAFYTVGDGATSVVDSGLTVVDGDDSNLDSATATITNLQDAASEVLSVTPSGAIVAGDISYNNGVLSINKVAPLADYQSVLRSLKYHNTASQPGGTSRSITVVVNDSYDNSVAATSTVTFRYRPVISSFTPGYGKRGQLVTINGSLFTGVTGVKFNGTSVAASEVRFISDSKLQVTVPVGATTGQISVTTAAGTGNSSNIFVVDNTVPVVAITSHNNDDVVSGLSFINGTASDEIGGSGLKAVFLTIYRSQDKRWWNGTGWSSTQSLLSATLNSNNGTWSYAGGPGSLSESGIYQLQAYAHDWAGNTNRAARRLWVGTVDITAPVVDISSHNNDDVVSGLSFINGTASDEIGGSGLKAVFLIIYRSQDKRWWNGTGWSSTQSLLSATLNSNNGTWSYAGGPASLSESGIYQLQAYAYDWAGNTGRTAKRLFGSSVSPSQLAPGGESQLSSSTRLSSIVVKNGSIGLTFNGALDSTVAVEVERYQVEVDGKVVAIEGASYNASERRVTLLLAEGTLIAGAQVVANWNGLLDAGGRTVSGQIGPVIAR